VGCWCERVKLQHGHLDACLGPDVWVRGLKNENINGVAQHVYEVLKPLVLAVLVLKCFIR
jgi:hypothetical protein